MTDSSKDCKIYIIHCFLFSFSDPLISNFAQLPTIGNSKMPDTYMKIIFSQRYVSSIHVLSCPNVFIIYEIGFMMLRAMLANSMMREHIYLYYSIKSYVQSVVRNSICIKISTWRLYC